jgi:pimeloyl-ACP methyl ester carboxylesterase
MAAFVLVHGAWHGGWCYDRLVPALKALGHRVVTGDLPGHGDDRTPAAQVTLDAYVARAGEWLEAAGEPAHLLGHSMGGMVITQAGEAYAPRIRSLIYLCAFLPASGQALLNFRGSDELNSLLVIDRESGASRIEGEGLRDVFYGDCSDADVAAARSRLCPQPLEPIRKAVQVGARYASLPRHYIECLQDGAIPIEVQRGMHAAIPCRVHALDASHSPFYSMPEQLASLLDAIARTSR